MRVTFTTKFFNEGKEEYWELLPEHDGTIIQGSNLELCDIEFDDERMRRAINLLKATVIQDGVLSNGLMNDIQNYLDGEE